MSKQKKTIGIIALQGSFIEHKKMLEKLDANVILIRDLPDIENKKIDGVILPGGESTTIIQLLKKTGLDKWLIWQAKLGIPIFGTCAGMIVLADLGLIDIDVERNAYGSQLDSFETKLRLETQNSPAVRCFERSSDGKLKTRNLFPGIFIRAPKVKKTGARVKVLAYHKKTPVLVRQNNIMAVSFHPELTDDMRVHEYFITMTNPQ
jgi:pyridoxal 5'-phosphate synthase pdxT subunit